MDVSLLPAHLKYIEANGVTLCCDERMRLELAFEQLMADIGVDGKLFFWGKIRGKFIRL